MPAEQLLQWTSDWQPDRTWTGAEPVHSDLLPLLTLCVEQRAWLKAIRAFLADERDNPPPFSRDGQTCAPWQQSASITGRIPPEMRQAADTLLDQLQHTASEVCERHGQHPKGHEATAMIELETQHAVLIKLLKHMIVHAAPPTGQAAN
jgi:hypothetical protein